MTLKCAVEAEPKNKNFISYKSQSRVFRYLKDNKILLLIISELIELLRTCNGRTFGLKIK